MSGYIPCPWCNKKFETDKQLKKHIKSTYRQGHGNKKCSHCKQTLSKCKDVDAVGQAFQCSPIQELPRRRR
jgi:hypothetical protein